MFSRPSSRFVDFGEVLKRARPLGTRPEAAQLFGQLSIAETYTSSETTSRPRVVTNSRPLCSPFLGVSFAAVPGEGSGTGNVTGGRKFAHHDFWGLRPPSV
jgi:hypothetical protein